VLATSVTRAPLTAPIASATLSSPPSGKSVRCDNVSAASRVCAISERSIRAVVARRIFHDTIMVATISVTAAMASELRNNRVRNVTVDRPACTRTA
jgi:hypothetical protein